MKRNSLLILLFVFWFGCSCVWADVTQLKSDFADPPRQYSLVPFWPWNDTLEPERLKWQIDQMVEKHVYGAFMHARKGINKGKTPYFSEGWWTAVDASIKHGDKVGFNPWLYDEDKWPSGAAGGRTIAVNPAEFLQKGLVFSTMEIEGPQKIRLSSAEDLVALIAAKFTSRGVVAEESLSDISEFAGQSWAIPEGKWLIMTFRQITEEHSRSGPQRGIDYLDKEAVATFIKITHEQYHKRFGKYFGNVVPGIFFDEITAKLTRADFTWTDDFLEQFKRIKGYDLKKYLPLLVYDGGKLTPKIRCDYYDVFTTLYEDAWFRQIADWCTEHNIALTGHSYEDIYSFVTQGDFFRTMSHLHIPMTDNEDFRYSFPRYVEWFKPKQMASIAHLNGRDLVAVEALGSNNWGCTLDELRYGLSMLHVYGLNFMILHSLYYTTDTPETSSDFPPSWFYQNPCWKYFGKVGKFAQRLAYMGRQGNHVCDVAILYPITSQWVSGRREGGLGKKYTPEELEDILSAQYFNVQKTLLENQIDYDIIDPASLLKADVADGKIKIAKEKYSVLILPPLSTVRRATIQKVKHFYQNGGTVIALNTLPLDSMEAGRKDPVVVKTVKDVFGLNPVFLRSGYFEVNQARSEQFITNKNEKGGTAHLTKWVDQVPRIIDTAVERDVIIKKGNTEGLKFLHNRSDDTDIYYLVNAQRLAQSWTVSVKSAGAVEKWHPETGQIEQIYGQQDGPGRMELSLNFDPWESYYVVFDKTKAGTEKKTLPQTSELVSSLPPVILDGQWNFMPAGSTLDYKWQSSVETSRIPLPVMQFAADRSGRLATIEQLLSTDEDDIRFKQIKIKDGWNTTAGCGRYLSSWDGWWITYVDLKPHWGRVAGDRIRFRKKFNLDKTVKGAWLGLTAEKKYELFVNGKEVGKDDNYLTAETYQVTSYLKKGENLIEVLVTGGGVLLAQGRVTLKDGSSVNIVSDDTWEAARDGVWSQAFEYVNPPLGPWGNVELEKQPVKFPVTLWYRQELPKGAVAMDIPLIRGDYEVYVNGSAISSGPGRQRIDFKHLLGGGKNILTIKVAAQDSSGGLIVPVTLICEPTEVELKLWADYGLDWYSGRCLYWREFVLPKEYLDSGTKLILNLGYIQHFAEIWVNDKLVETRIWQPYEVEIQDFVKPGSNKLTIVAANLVTNKMKWNIFDQMLVDRRARWGHDLHLLRDPSVLDSGLLGPVRIEPVKKPKVAISALN